MPPTAFSGSRFSPGSPGTTLREPPPPPSGRSPAGRDPKSSPDNENLRTKPPVYWKAVPLDGSALGQSPPIEYHWTEDESHTHTHLFQGTRKSRGWQRQHRSGNIAESVNHDSEPLSVRALPANLRHYGRCLAATKLPPHRQTG